MTRTYSIRCTPQQKEQIDRLLKYQRGAQLLVEAGMLKEIPDILAAFEAIMQPLCAIKDANLAVQSVVSKYPSKIDFGITPTTKEPEMKVLSHDQIKAKLAQLQVEQKIEPTVDNNEYCTPDNVPASLLMEFKQYQQYPWVFERASANLKKIAQTREDGLVSFNEVRDAISEQIASIDL